MTLPSPSAASDALVAFGSIELSHDLFELTWDDVQVWPLVRLGVFHTILTAIGVFKYRGVLPAQKRFEARPWQRNPLLGVGRWPIMTFRWGRVQRLAGKPLDIYTDPLSEVLVRARATMVDLSPGTIDGNLPLDETTVSQVPLAATWGRLSNRMQRLRAPVAPPDAVVRRLNAAQSAIGRIFPVDLDLVSVVTAAKAEHDRQALLWAPVFAVRRPRLVIMGTQSYGFEGLVTAARRAGATVAELQHGLVYDAHLAYHFPARMPVRHKPDVFLTFGEWWHDRFNYPTNMRLHVVGFRALEDAALRRRNRARPRPCLAVLTGDQLFGDALIPALTSIRQHLPDLPIAVRPHPTDAFPYSAAIAAANIGCTRITDPAIESVHEFLSACTCTLSAASTSVVESVVLGLPTVTVLAGMTNVMRPVLEAGGSIICNDISRLGHAIAAAAPPASSILFDASTDRFEEFVSQYA